MKHLNSLARCQARQLANQTGMVTCRNHDLFAAHPFDVWHNHKIDVRCLLTASGFHEAPSFTPTKLQGHQPCSALAWYSDCPFVCAAHKSVQFPTKWGCSVLRALPCITLAFFLGIFAIGDPGWFR